MIQHHDIAKLANFTWLLEQASKFYCFSSENSTCDKIAFVLLRLHLVILMHLKSPIAEFHLHVDVKTIVSILFWHFTLWWKPLVKSIREECLYYISSKTCLSSNTYEVVLFLSPFVRMYMTCWLCPLDLNWFQIISVLNLLVMIPEWIAAAHTCESDVYTSVPHRLLVCDWHPIGQFTMNWEALSVSAVFTQTPVRR